MTNEMTGFARIPATQLYENIVDTLIGGLDDGNRTVLTVALDGKAAAGKSTWARILADRLKTRGRNAVILEADWFLKARDWRSLQMEKVGKDKDVDWGSVVPQDFHLQFWFWDKLFAVIERVKAEAETGAGKPFVLPDLYNRKTGFCDGVEELSILPGDVLIVPGSYLLSKRQRVFDSAILLYVNKEEGMRRKLSRESEKGEFPTGERIGDVISTWERIEEPTFLSHMLANGNLANVIVDNSDHITPSVIKFAFEQSVTTRAPAHMPEWAQMLAGSEPLLRFVRQQPGRRRPR